MIRPERWRRIAGSTARVTVSSPSTLTAKTARTSSADASSTAPSSPRPALLTSTSRRPKRASAAATAASAWRSSATSSATGSRRSCVPSARVTACGSRAAATTRSPRASAARAISSPNPREAPVMNHVSCCAVPMMTSRCDGRVHATAVPRLALSPADGEPRAVHRPRPNIGTKSRYVGATSPGPSAGGRCSAAPVGGIGYPYATGADGAAPSNAAPARVTSRCRACACATGGSCASCRAAWRRRAGRRGRRWFRAGCAGWRRVRWRRGCRRRPGGGAGVRRRKSATGTCNTGPVDTMTARSIAFSSSRTLPGQSYALQGGHASRRGWSRCACSGAARSAARCSGPGPGCPRGARAAAAARSGRR